MSTPTDLVRRSNPGIRSSTPERSRQVTFHTDFAQRLYRRVWDRVKADLFVLTVRTRSNNMRDAAKASDTWVAEQFDKVAEELQREIQRVDVLIDQQQLTDESPSYEGAITVEARYSTPQSNQFLTLIVTMDNLLQRLDTLWLAGIITGDQRMSNCIQWQRRLTHVANRLRHNGNGARKTIERAFAERNTRQRRVTSGAPADGGGGDVALADTVAGDAPDTGSPESTDEEDEFDAPDLDAPEEGDSDGDAGSVKVVSSAAAAAGEKAGPAEPATTPVEGVEVPRSRTRRRVASG